jgi:hypothetical protein
MVEIRPGDADALSQLADKIEGAEERFIVVVGASFAAGWNRFLWSWAIQLSGTVASVPLISDVMVCAQAACGSEAYAMFRERVLPHMENEEDLKQLDALSVQARDLVASKPRRPYVTRLLDVDEVMVFERKF